MKAFSAARYSARLDREITHNSHLIGMEEKKRRRLAAAAAPFFRIILPAKEVVVVVVVVGPPEPEWVSPLRHRESQHLLEEYRISFGGQ